MEKRAICGGGDRKGGGCVMVPGGFFLSRAMGGGEATREEGQATLVERSTRHRRRLLPMELHKVSTSYLDPAWQDW